MYSRFEATFPWAFRNLITRSSMGAIVALSSAAVCAQQPQTGAAGPAYMAGDGVLTEIIVTASRRTGTLVDTAVAVGVVSGESLESLNISSFQDLARIEPALIVNNQGTSGNQFVIRGVLSDIGSTTGFYLDEVPLVGGAALEESGDGKPGLRLHDIERIEVLKGPQGTLFGAGSLAGTLRIITNKPDFGSIGGGFNVSHGFVDGGNPLKLVDGYVNAPVSDSIAVRVTGWGEFGGGYVDQRTGLDHATLLDDVNDREVIGGRAQILLHPTDNLSLLGAITHQTISVDGTQAWTDSESIYNATTRSQEPYEDRYALYSLTAEYDLPFGTISAIGSYAEQYGRMVADSTFTGQILAGIAGSIFCNNGVPAFPGFNCPPDPGVISYVNTQDFSDYTGELRFTSSFNGPLQVVSGVFYERDENTWDATAPRADPSTGAVACYTVSECTSMNLRRNIPYAVRGGLEVDQWAVYGQADYELTDKLTATVGARYYSADISRFDQELQNFITGIVNVVDAPGEIESYESTDSSPSYAFSLLYEATPDLSLYARAASGFRIGGVNRSVEIAESQGISVPEDFGSDELWSYEFGAKTYWLDRRFYSEMTVYQMDWTDQQINAADSTGSFNYVVNAGKTRIRGVELANTFRAGGFFFGAGAAYTHAKLVKDLPPDVIVGGTIGLAGDRMPRIPKWNVSAHAEYRRSIGAGEAYFQTSASYRSGSHYSFNDQNVFNIEIPSYVMSGAAIGWQIGAADFSLYAENLSNDGERSGLSAKPDAVRVYAASPRTIGARVQVRFGPGD